MKNIDNVRSIHEKMQENKKLQEMMKDSENEDAFGLETAAKLL